MITNSGLLYIEPTNPPSETPVLDGLTARMAAALRHPDATGILAKGGKFHEGVGSRGVHHCKCGARSSSVDYKLANGLITNALATHYLAWHRDEVPSDQLVLVGTLPESEDPVEMNETKVPVR